MESRLYLLDVGLVLEVVTGDKIRDIIIVLVILLVLALALLLLHALVALGKLPQRRQRIGAELVKDTGDELGKLLVLTVAVDGEGVGRDGGVDYERC
jgi:hypothetical protein